MSDTPEFVKDYLKLVKQGLIDKYGLDAEHAAIAVHKSAIRGIVKGDNVEMRRLQMHRSIESAVDDVYNQYQKGLSASIIPNIDEEVLLKTKESTDSERSRHKEAMSVLADIPLKNADD